MLKKLAGGVLGAFVLVSNVAAADEQAPQPPREPVQLSDAELDQITAGITVLLFTPGNGGASINEPNRTILITGGASSTFGVIITPNGRVITIPSH